MSLCCGAILNLAVCRYAGKGQSELGMLRTLWNLFQPGDILLADRLMCTWTEMVMLKQRGVDSVCRLSSHRKADFRRGKRLAHGDHTVQWPKPTRPRSIDRETYDALPEFLMIRECRVRVEQPGFRVKSLTIATMSSDNYSSPSTTTIIPDLPSIAANVNDNYFSRSAGQLILPGRSVARYGSRAG
jgi:hypothetical protein